MQTSDETQQFNHWSSLEEDEPKPPSVGVRVAALAARIADVGCTPPWNHFPKSAGLPPIKLHAELPHVAHLLMGPEHERFQHI